MIKIENLAFRFSQSGFSLVVPLLEIGQGERVALMGPSGSGKTTLLHLISGILTPDQGTIRMLEQDLSHLSESARRSFRLNRMGLIFQNFELISYLTVLENILLPWVLDRRVQAEGNIHERAQKLAETAGLGHRLHQYPDRLSQGEKQRVSICRAMLGSPRIVLADEPTSQLDPVTKRQIMALLLDQVAKHNATLVLVTHDEEIAGQLPRVINCREFAREAQTQP